MFYNKERIKRFIRNQVNRRYELGLFLLVRNYLLLLLTPFLLLIVLLVRLLRPLILIRFGELMSSRIGHFLADTEIYLCERDLGMHDEGSLDIFYTNSRICNRQLMKMWNRTLCILPFAMGLDLINRALPAGERHKIPYRSNQCRDIYGTLESTAAHIAFTKEEESIGWALLNRLGITNQAPFICFISRDSAYLDAVYPKGNWRYHDYRDSDIKSFIPAAEELTHRGYFALRMGNIVREPLEVGNPKIIDYATKHRSDFLDIFLGAKCYFFLGDSCGYTCIPMIFRKPLVIINIIPLEYTYTWGSNYLFIPKKLWLKKDSRFLSFKEILGSEIGKFTYNQQYRDLGIEVVENTPEEITDAAIEMDQRLKGEWQTSGADEELQRRFWAHFKPSEINRVFRARIGAKFLRQNKELLN